MTKRKTPSVIPTPSTTTIPRAVSITAPRRTPTLAQSRLAGVDEGLKFVRHRTSAEKKKGGGKKQVGLGAFGFEATPNKRKRIEVDDEVQDEREQNDGTDGMNEGQKEREVPETQVAQVTQSPYFQFPHKHEHGEYSPSRSASSSPLSSPPLISRENSDVSNGEGESQAPTSSAAAMPPPPVTPKRRRVLEIPDSASPPATPLSPWRSQQQQQWVPAGMARRLFATNQSPGKSNATVSPKKRTEAMDPHSNPPEPALPPTIDRNRTIASSQWWEVEEDAPLSTQSMTQTQTQSFPDDESNSEESQESQESVATVILAAPHRPTGVMETPEEVEGPEDTETFRVDLTYKKEELGVVLESQDLTRSRGMYSEIESQGSFRSMQFPYSCPPPAQSRTSPTSTYTADSEPESELPTQPLPPRERTQNTLLPNESTQSTYQLPSMADSTASEEDNGEEEDEAPHYRPYRTQQLPSSFVYASGTYQVPHEPLIESQWIPGPVRKRHEQKDPTQWVAPEIMTHESATRDEPSQFLPIAEETEPEQEQEPEVEVQVEVPATPPEAMQASLKRGYWDKRDKDKEDDDDEDIRIATSQLLPSELMETFPMPPPLSQYSSYGFADVSFDEAETQ